MHLETRPFFPLRFGVTKRLYHTVCTAMIRLNTSESNTTDLASPADLKSLDASSARELVNQSIAQSHDLSVRYRDLQQSLANAYISKILKQIHARAKKGKTDLAYPVRDRWLPSEHRDVVIEIIRYDLDERGFNVLTMHEQSFFGNVTIFKLEW